MFFSNALAYVAEKKASKDPFFADFTIDGTVDVDGEQQEDDEEHKEHKGETQTTDRKSSPWNSNSHSQENFCSKEFIFRGSSKDYSKEKDVQLANLRGSDPEQSETEVVLDVRDLLEEDQDEQEKIIPVGIKNEHDLLLVGAANKNKTAGAFSTSMSPSEQDMGKTSGSILSTSNPTATTSLADDHDGFFRASLRSAISPSKEKALVEHLQDHVEGKRKTTNAMTNHGQDHDQEHTGDQGASSTSRGRLEQSRPEGDGSMSKTTKKSVVKFGGNIVNCTSGGSSSSSSGTSSSSSAASPSCNSGAAVAEKNTTSASSTATARTCASPSIFSRKRPSFSSSSSAATAILSGKLPKNHQPAKMKKVSTEDADLFKAKPVQPFLFYLQQQRQEQSSSCHDEVLQLQSSNTICKKTKLQHVGREASAALLDKKQHVGRREVAECEKEEEGHDKKDDNERKIDTDFKFSRAGGLGGAAGGAAAAPHTGRTDVLLAVDEEQGGDAVKSGEPEDEAPGPAGTDTVTGTSSSHGPAATSLVTRKQVVLHSDSPSRVGELQVQVEDHLHEAGEAGAAMKGDEVGGFLLPLPRRHGEQAAVEKKSEFYNYNLEATTGQGLGRRKNGASNNTLKVEPDGVVLTPPAQEVEDHRKITENQADVSNFFVALQYKESSSSSSASSSASGDIIDPRGVAPSSTRNRTTHSHGNEDVDEVDSEASLEEQDGLLDDDDDNDSSRKNKHSSGRVASSSSRGRERNRSAGTSTSTRGRNKMKKPSSFHPHPATTQHLKNPAAASAPELRLQLRLLTEYNAELETECETRQREIRELRRLLRDKQEHIAMQKSQFLELESQTIEKDLRIKKLEKEYKELDEKTSMRITMLKKSAHSRGDRDPHPLGNSSTLTTNNHNFLQGSAHFLNADFLEEITKHDTLLHAEKELFIKQMLGFVGGEVYEKLNQKDQQVKQLKETHEQQLADLRKQLLAEDRKFTEKKKFFEKQIKQLDKQLKETAVELADAQDKLDMKELLEANKIRENKFAKEERENYEKKLQEMENEVKKLDVEVKDRESALRLRDDKIADLEFVVKQYGEQMNNMVETTGGTSSNRAGEEGGAAGAADVAGVVSTDKNMTDNPYLMPAAASLSATSPSPTRRGVFHAPSSTIGTASKSPFIQKSFSSASKFDQHNLKDPHNLLRNMINSNTSSSSAIVPAQFLRQLEQQQNLLQQNFEKEKLYLERRIAEVEEERDAVSDLLKIEKQKFLKDLSETEKNWRERVEELQESLHKAVQGKSFSTVGAAHPHDKDPLTGGVSATPSEIKSDEDRKKQEEERSQFVKKLEVELEDWKEKARELKSILQGRERNLIEEQMENKRLKKAREELEKEVKKLEKEKNKATANEGKATRKHQKEKSLLEKINAVLEEEEGGSSSATAGPGREDESQVDYSNTFLSGAGRPASNKSEKTKATSTSRSASARSVRDGGFSDKNYGTGAVVDNSKKKNLSFWDQGTKSKDSPFLQVENDPQKNLIQVPFPRERSSGTRVSPADVDVSKSTSSQKIRGRSSPTRNYVPQEAGGGSSSSSSRSAATTAKKNEEKQILRTIRALKQQVQNAESRAEEMEMREALDVLQHGEMNNAARRGGLLRSPLADFYNGNNFSRLQRGGLSSPTTSRRMAGGLAAEPLPPATSPSFQSRSGFILQSLENSRNAVKNSMRKSNFGTTTTTDTGADSMSTPSGPSKSSASTFVKNLIDQLFSDKLDQLEQEFKVKMEELHVEEDKALAAIDDLENEESAKLDKQFFEFEDEDMKKEQEEEILNQNHIRDEKSRVESLTRNTSSSSAKVKVSTLGQDINRRDRSKSREEGSVMLDDDDVENKEQTPTALSQETGKKTTTSSTSRPAMKFALSNSLSGNNALKTDIAARSSSPTMNNGKSPKTTTKNAGNTTRSRNQYNTNTSNKSNKPTSEVGKQSARDRHYNRKQKLLLHKYEPKKMKVMNEFEEKRNILLVQQEADLEKFELKRQNTLEAVNNAIQTDFELMTLKNENNAKFGHGRNQEHFAELAEKCYAQVEELRNMHEKEVEKLKREHDLLLEEKILQKTDQILTDSTNEIRGKETKFENEIKQLEESYERKISLLKLDLETTAKQIEKKANLDLEILQEKFDNLQKDYASEKKIAAVLRDQAFCVGEIVQDQDDANAPPAATTSEVLDPLDAGAGAQSRAAKTSPEKNSKQKLLDYFISIRQASESGNGSIATSPEKQLDLIRQKQEQVTQMKELHSEVQRLKQELAHLELSKVDHEMEIVKQSEKREKENLKSLLQARKEKDEVQVKLSTTTAELHSKTVTINEFLPRLEKELKDLKEDLQLKQTRIEKLQKEKRKLTDSQFEQTQKMKEDSAGEVNQLKLELSKANHELHSQTLKNEKLEKLVVETEAELNRFKTEVVEELKKNHEEKLADTILKHEEEKKGMMGEHEEKVRKLVLMKTVDVDGGEGGASKKSRRSRSLSSKKSNRKLSQQGKSKEPAPSRRSVDATLAKLTEKELRREAAEWKRKANYLEKLLDEARDREQELTERLYSGKGRGDHTSHRNSAGAVATTSKNLYTASSASPTSAAASSLVQKDEKIRNLEQQLESEKQQREQEKNLNTWLLQSSAFGSSSREHRGDFFDSTTSGGGGGRMKDRLPKGSTAMGASSSSSSVADDAKVEKTLLYRRKNDDDEENGASDISEQDADGMAAAVETTSVSKDFLFLEGDHLMTGPASSSGIASSSSMSPFSSLIPSVIGSKDSSLMPNNSTSGSIAMEVNYSAPASQHGAGSAAIEISTTSRSTSKASSCGGSLSTSLRRSEQVEVQPEQERPPARSGPDFLFYQETTPAMFLKNKKSPAASTYGGASSSGAVAVSSSSSATPLAPAVQPLRDGIEIRPQEQVEEEGFQGLRAPPTSTRTRPRVSFSTNSRKNYELSASCSGTQASRREDSFLYYDENSAEEQDVEDRERSTTIVRIDVDDEERNLEEDDHDESLSSAAEEKAAQKIQHLMKRQTDLFGKNTKNQSSSSTSSNRNSNFLFVQKRDFEKLESEFITSSSGGSFCGVSFLQVERNDDDEEMRDITGVGDENQQQVSTSAATTKRLAVVLNNIRQLKKALIQSKHDSKLKKQLEVRLKLLQEKQDKYKKQIFEFKNFMDEKIDQKFNQEAEHERLQKKFLLAKAEELQEFEKELQKKQKKIIENKQKAMLEIEKESKTKEKSLAKKNLETHKAEMRNEILEQEVQKMEKRLFEEEELRKRDSEEKQKELEKVKEDLVTQQSLTNASKKQLEQMTKDLLTAGGTKFQHDKIANENKNLKQEVSLMESHLQDVKKDLEKAKRLLKEGLLVKEGQNAGGSLSSKKSLQEQVLDEFALLQAHTDQLHSFTDDFVFDVVVKSRLKRETRQLKMLQDLVELSGINEARKLKMQTTTNKNDGTTTGSRGGELDQDGKDRPLGAVDERDTSGTRTGLELQQTHEKTSSSFFPNATTLFELDAFNEDFFQVLKQTKPAIGA
ncbi:unnamed protein product [Amoebophrya sp. A120]|nr:unnamed protein product [Amoebophrya sp. A120]|eukprot:GSA120T00014373001.1